ncbi:hypothetical protein [Enterovirga sp. CN4-39]|uniref:hypothetical protein n=1 Tax=Enterovirga sp. CN4-39 TaxID=3400910 RepID=UPI003C106B5F
MSADLDLSPAFTPGVGSLQSPAALAPLSEHHLVAAALNVQLVQTHTATLLTRFMTNPRAEGEILGLLVDLQSALERAGGAYRAYCEVRSCVGRA